MASNVKETLENLGHKVGDAVGAAGAALGSVTHKLGFDFDPSAGTIFITGGNGVVSYRVATQLLKAGYPHVRLGVRNPDKVSELNKQGAEIADFSWEREDTYEKALAGVKTVFCVTPHHEAWHKRFPAFLAACKTAGVRNFLKLSFYHARRSGDAFQDVPLVKLHGDCDEMLENSGMAYVILAASHFMSNHLVYQGALLRSDFKPTKFYGASAGKGVNYVSPNDIAEVAVRCLLTPKNHVGKEYTLTGPEAITDQEVASLLGKHLSKPVMYVDQPMHTFADTERMGGIPAWLLADLVALERVKASGKEEDVAFVSKDIETICGRPAETYQEYLLAAHQMTTQEAA